MLTSISLHLLEQQNLRYYITLIYIHSQNKYPYKCHNNYIEILILFRDEYQYH